MNVIYATMTSSNQSLALPMEIDMASHGCALFEIKGTVFPHKEVSLFLCVDFIEDSILGSRMMPILRRIQLTPNQYREGGAIIDQTFDKMLWLPCNRSPVRELRLYITDDRGNIIPFEETLISCTLVIIPHR